MGTGRAEFLQEEIIKAIKAVKAKYHSDWIEEIFGKKLLNDPTIKNKLNE